MAEHRLDAPAVFVAAFVVLDGPLAVAPAGDDGDRALVTQGGSEPVDVHTGVLTSAVAAELAARSVLRLLPGSNVGLSQEMPVDGLVRQVRSEVGHALSRGTQEQLAILTRLAFADLLLDKQRPVSIVLDDALVYSDDDRLEVMTDILADAAKRMQIILLTCRAKTFRNIEATRLSSGKRSERMCYLI